MTQSRAASGGSPKSMWRWISRATRAASSAGLDVPRLVEQRPGPLPQQQVVPLGDHERDVARHRHGAGDRLLDLAPELGRVDDRVVALAQPPQQRDVAEPSNVSGAPLRSARPSRSSSTCAKWKPSMPTSAACVGRARARCARPSSTCPPRAARRCPARAGRRRRRGGGRARSARTRRAPSRRLSPRHRSCHPCARASTVVVCAASLAVASSGCGSSSYRSPDTRAQQSSAMTPQLVTMDSPAASTPRGPTR